MFQFIRDAAYIGARNRFSERTQLCTDRSKCLLLRLLTREKTKRLLHLRERTLCAANIVMRRLPRDAQLLADLREGKVLRNVQTQTLALLSREKPAVQVIQSCELVKSLHAHHLFLNTVGIIAANKEPVKYFS